MMKRRFAVMVLVGCGAKPAEPLAVSPPLTPNELQLSRPPPRGPVRSFDKAAASPHVMGPGDLVFPRPVLETAIEPPDVTELGRWPLTVAEHPALEPHFDIAAALAYPGISWTDLCARGAQHRHLSAQQELVDYLDAWCTAETGNYGGAIEKLGHLRTAPNARLVEKLKFDVAALAAAHGLARDLESFLRDGGFLDVEHVDLISAAYFEIGKLEDAAEANRLAETMDRAPSEKVECTRLLRAIADSSPDGRDAVIEDLRRLASPPADSPRPPRCRAQYHMVQCWSGGSCNDYWASLGPASEADGLARLGHVYYHWERNFSGFDWHMAAEEVSQAEPFRDRYRLLVPALDLALRTVDCGPLELGAIEDIAKYAIAELSPPKPLSTVPETYTAVKHESERTTELAKLRPDEIKAFRFRLETVLTEAQHLFPLMPADCAKMRARLPPVQP